METWLTLFVVPTQRRHVLGKSSAASESELQTFQIR